MEISQKAALIQRFKSTSANAYYAQRYTTASLLKNAFSTITYRRNIVESFNEKNVILTVTAGRTGSDTLSKIYDGFPGTISLHEPQPQYRYILERIQRNPVLASHFFQYIKAPSIVGQPTHNYLETSHLFCKGFFEPCLANGFKPSFIMLHRNRRETALSHLRKGAVPGRTAAGRGYLISPYDPVYVSIGSPEQLTDYQLCFWYCLEIEHRQEIYAEVCNEMNLSYRNIATDDLNDLSAMADIADYFGLAPKEVSQSILINRVGIVYNSIKKGHLGERQIDFQREERYVLSNVTSYAGVDDVFEKIRAYRRSVV